jgi:hypothetical protein
VSCQFHAPDSFPRGKSPRYPLDRRLGGPQNQSGLELDPSIVQSVASSYTDHAIPAACHRFNTMLILYKARNKTCILNLFFYFLYPSLLYRTLTASRFLFYSLDLYTIGRTPWTSDRPVARSLPVHKQKNAHTHQTSMPEVGFEPTITASPQAKTIHALDGSATVTTVLNIKIINIK